MGKGLTRKIKQGEMRECQLPLEKGESKIFD
jgi:hypothetical protein